MTGKLKSFLPFLLVLASCGPDDVPPLLVSDVTIFAPLPGQSMAVAYLSLRNQTVEPIVITHVASPEFARVEMHATVFGNGIAEMLALDSITIAARSAIEFATGGKHLMLMDLQETLAPGDDVTLEFHYGRDGLLTLSSPLRARNTGNVNRP